MAAPTDRDRPARGDEIPLVIASLACLLPIVLSAWVGVRHGWRPVGDNAMISLRVQHVFTHRPPLIGAVSTASIYTRSPDKTSHLGPMQFYALAPFYKLSGERAAGLVVGTAVVNLVAAIVAVRIVGRTFGRHAATVAAVALVLIELMIGAEQFRDPLNPTQALIPLALVIAAGVAAASGDRRALPALVVSASFVAQAHLMHPPLLLPALLVALVLCFRAPATQRTRLSPRGVLVGWLLLAVCWVGPAIDAADGGGNLRALKLAATSPDAPARIGAVAALKRVLSTLSASPFSIAADLRPDQLIQPISGARLAGGGVIVAALIGLLALAVVRGDRPRGVRMLAVTALALDVGAVLAIALLPIAIVSFAPYTYRWLIVVVAVNWIAVTALLIAPIAERLETVPPGVVIVGGLAGLAVVVAITVHEVPIDRADDSRAYPIQRALEEELADLPLVSTRLDYRGPTALELYHPAVGLWLEARDVRVEVTAGSRDRFDLHDPPRPTTQTLTVVSGSAEPPPCARLIGRAGHGSGRVRLFLKTRDC